VFKIDLAPHEKTVPLELAWVKDMGRCVMACEVMCHRDQEYVVLAKGASIGVVSGWSKISLMDMTKREELGEQYDIANYVTSLTVIKNTVLISDLNHGLTFLIWTVVPIICCY